MIVLAILLPPIAVFMTTRNPMTILMNIILTILGWIPGSIHAVIVVNNARNDKRLKQMENRLIDTQARIAESQAKAQEKAAKRVSH